MRDWNLEFKTSEICPSLFHGVGDGGDPAVRSGERGKDAVVTVCGHRVDGEIVPGLSALNGGTGIMGVPEPRTFYILVKVKV